MASLQLSPVDTPDEAYARLASDLSRAVARICPRWIADRRDDLVQVALMRVMAVQRQSAAPLNAAYLRRAAWSALVDEIRARRRRREVALEEAAPLDVLAGAGADPEARAASAQIGEGIAACLAGLIDARRLAVTLHLQGHTIPESAAILGWTVKRTENLVYRGLADLRGCLRAKGLTP